MHRQNFVVGFFTYAPHIVKFTTSGWSIGAGTAGDISEYFGRRKGVPWKIELRDDHNVPFLSIFDKLFHLFLGVVSTIALIA